MDPAKALGDFAEVGLDVNLLHFKGGAVTGAGLIGGSAEVSVNAIDHVIKAEHQEQELRSIVSFAHLPGTSLGVNLKCRSEARAPRT